MTAPISDHSRAPHPPTLFLPETRTPASGHLRTLERPTSHTIADVSWLPSHHHHRQLTPQEQARVAEARRLTRAEEDEIRRKGKQYKQEYDTARAAMHQALQLLKAERQRQGLSLSGIQRRAGIEPPNLSRLENDDTANPTIATLTRYAKALGKKLEIVLTDDAD